ncbi:hypothetical protein B0H14DRAFT_2655045 [Mycena olivaceomarginata]|nr:hypothetical protein B0H14DRAFT_2655045 [Mycena olivaceomarginata]
MSPGWKPNTATAVKHDQPFQDGIQCEIEEYARSGGGVGTAWYDTHLIDYYSQNTPREFQSYGKAGYNKDAKPVPTVEYGRVENIVRIAHDAEAAAGAGYGNFVCTSGISVFSFQFKQCILL